MSAPVSSPFLPSASHRPIPRPGAAGYRPLPGAATAGVETLSTGFADLDRLLPGGGWPLGGISELVAPPGFIDPLTLLLPALAALGSAPQRRWLTWIAPPHLPVAEDLYEQHIDLRRILLVHRRPATADRPGLDPLQLLERAIGAGHCAAVLAWIDRLERPRAQALNRAAQRHNTTVFLFRPAGSERQRCDTELRLYVSTHSSRLDIEILHSRCRPGAALRLPSPNGQPLFTPRYYRRGARAALPPPFALR